LTWAYLVVPLWSCCRTSFGVEVTRTYIRDSGEARRDRTTLCPARPSSVHIISDFRAGGRSASQACRKPSPAHPPNRTHNNTTPEYQSHTRITIAKMADKLRAQQQLEAQQARYIGIGSADTSKFEWMSNMQRDSMASYIGHPPLLQYMSIGLGQSREVTRVQLLERMVRPVGAPPEVRIED
jgi:splicing factor 3B subunit 5